MYGEVRSASTYPFIRSFFLSFPPFLDKCSHCLSVWLVD